MKFTIRHIVAVTILVMGCVACDTTPPAPKLAHVRKETASHVVAFHDGSTQMFPGEQDALASFVGTISTNTISAVGLAADDTNPRAIERARTVRDYLVRQGFSARDIRMLPDHSIDPLTVMLKVRYAKVLPPEPCPDWSKNSMHNYENTNASNFGCAYNNDLVMQLDNPNDYNQGHGTPAISAARDSVILQRYNSNTPPPTASGGASSGSSGGSSGSSGGGTTTTTTSSP